jgi:hypothetical protein
MRTYKFTLAALLLGAAGGSWAGVPVIQLAPSSGDSAGSFASYAGGAVSVLASSAAVMPLTTMGAGYGVLVAARPLPSIWAVLPLVLGSFVYLGRRRQNGFALRPARTLLERLEHAPVHA